MNTVDNTFALGAMPQTADTQAKDTGSSVMGKDDFLKLLVTQMSNQDPLNPMDGQQFAAQLAQFSSVEQLINIGDAVTNQSDMTGFLSQSFNNSVATSLIGKEVIAEDNHVTLTDSGKAAIDYDLSSAASEVKVSIKNADGQLVQTLTSEGVDAGANSLAWDGKDSNGNTLPGGTYTVEIEATDANGDGIAASPNVTGKIDRVTFGQDGVRLWMGDSSVSLGSIKSVQQP